MTNHSTRPGAYGPGTNTDVDFIPVPEDCARILRYLASVTPGFTQDSKLLDAVEFHGGDLPILPGPAKAQALVGDFVASCSQTLTCSKSAVLHGMAGIVSKEISALKGYDIGKVSIDVDHAGMYPASASLVSIHGKTMAAMHEDGSLFKMGHDLDGGCLTDTDMKFRAWSIYPTKDPKVWYQIMSNLKPYDFLPAYGLDPDAPVKSKDEAYEMIKAEITKYSARELEQKNMEHGFCGQTVFSPQAW